MAKGRVGTRQVMEALAGRRVKGGRTGRALGLDSEGIASRVVDVDIKNKPLLGGINKKNIWKANLTLPAIAEGSGADCEIDILRRGGYPEDMITSPGELDYFLDVHFIEANPMRLSNILFKGEDEDVIASMEIAVVRRTPFGETVEERVALSSYYRAESQQLSIVNVPIDCEMDGSTFIRLFYTKATTSKRCTMTLSFDKIAERRSALIRG